ncbi:MAG TPA: hypothetical protein VHJ99_08960 [Candidatus Dormibacteraeota bacterium]|nr:hypothetical protein [Candidatus Dormibacteraeota bacterium]
MRWPIDDNSDQDLGAYLFRPGLGKQVRERLLLERSIAKRHGFACFADYYMARRARGWGMNRLAQDTGQTRDWVRGVMRRYGPGDAGVSPDELQGGADTAASD